MPLPENSRCGFHHTGAQCRYLPSPCGHSRIKARQRTISPSLARCGVVMIEARMLDSRAD
jgi:hypothetical protein